MFRNSAWFLCSVLLCLGQVLSQESHIVKTPGVIPVEPNEVHPVVDHHESKNEKPVETPTANVPSHRDTDIPKIPPPNPEKSTSTKEPITTSQTHQPEPKPTPAPAPQPTPAPAPQPTPAPAPQPTPAPAPKPTPAPAPKPTTIPPAPSTSTPIPVTPTPGPQKGSWNYTNDKNITCLRIDGIFSIDYNDVLNKTKESVHYDIPKEASSSGKCTNTTDEISLFWNATNKLTFIFEKNGTEYVLKSFAGSIYLPYLRKQQPFNSNTNDTHFSTPVGQSYSCSSMKQVAVDQHAKVTLDQFHLQAFKTSSGAGFDTSKDCQEAQHTADIVPIVVGCVLALLVIAVLVAYLISRRRSQTRGYLSM